MFDILSAILYGEPIDLMGKKALEAPRSPEEIQICTLLQAMEDQGVARRLQENIQILARVYHREAFLSGTRFGAQLMLQLKEKF